MSGENFDIFISYRRSDGLYKARMITETLKGKNYRCFFDLDKLHGGKFDDKLKQAIKDAPIFIAVMTPDYLVRPKKDKEEENQNEDKVYEEIEFAQKYGKYIITINCNGQIKSIPNEVPLNISQALSAHTFAEVHAGQTYESNMEKLIKDWISKVLPPPSFRSEEKAKLSVKTDANCELIDDDKIIATLQEGTTKQIFVERGEYEFTARSTEYPNVEQIIEKRIDDIKFKYILKIELANKVQERKKEIEEKEKEERIRKDVEEFLKKQVSILQTLKGHLREVTSVAYSPDGTKIISGSRDTTVKIWDANTGQCLQTLKGHSRSVYSVSYSPDGTKIISGSNDRTIKIWNANTGEYLQTLVGDSWQVYSVSYSPDGTKIISGSRDNTVKIWDAKTGECLKSLEGHLWDVNSVAYSPDGTKIISGSVDNTIKIWDANTGECLKTLEGHSKSVKSVAYSPDGTKIISGSVDETIKIWDANTGQCLKTLKGHSWQVCSVAYSPDGTKIISGSEGKTIKIWDAKTGECLQTLKGHSSWVNSLAYSPDGTRIISGSKDKTIKKWGVEYGLICFNK